MSATPETPDPLARVIEAVAAEIERDDDNSYCTYADTARQAVRAAAPLLLEAVVAEIGDPDLAMLYHDPEARILDTLTAALTRLLAGGEEGRGG